MTAHPSRSWGGGFDLPTILKRVWPVHREADGRSRSPESPVPGGRWCAATEQKSVAREISSRHGGDGKLIV